MGDGVTAVEATALVEVGAGMAVGVTAVVGDGVGATLGIVVGPCGDDVPEAVWLIVGVSGVGVAVAGLTAGAVVDRGTGGLGAGVVVGDRM